MSGAPRSVAAGENGPGGEQSTEQASTGQLPRPHLAESVLYREAQPFRLASPILHEPKVQGCGSQ